MDNRDPITKDWFRPETVKVEVDDGCEQILMGFGMSEDGSRDNYSLVRLSGAIRDSVLKVAFVQNVLELRVQNPEFLASDMVRYIYQGDEGLVFHVENAAFALAVDYRSLGIGTRSFAIEAYQAAEIGFGKITTDAIGDFSTLLTDDPSQQYSGYYTWARLGYDAELSPDFFVAGTEAFQDAKLVSELMATDEGREIWARFGKSTNMEFDLSVNSNSWVRLLAYLAEKRIEVMP